ncbi:hypothetical protein OGAPHI_001835 [Ogataea philodendri]|uniref:DUF202 domain-containing protein n=1 Tax=Ogataea philodendri TaxID=1378263 RepID=A0A9P8PAB9_9ASCO|nr:uncharacterized protein OGAPHI_001835 [Ogataea philodendri]KAH3668081.1 hypothetical protein OGAPHI_001835 [Ogataea philodendri]
MGLTIVTPAGAVARDHLSNERTMLAYLRTSMAFLSLGIAVIKLAKYAIINPLQDLNLDEYPKILRHDLYIASKYSKPLGILSLVACLVALGCGIVRFWTMHKRLIKSRPFSSGTIPALLISLSILPGKVHGSLARAGKVKSQTPKVDKTEKPKQPKGRAYKRLQYTKRFVNVANTIVSGINEFDTLLQISKQAETVVDKDSQPENVSGVNIFTEPVSAILWIVEIHQLNHSNQTICSVCCSEVESRAHAGEHSAQCVAPHLGCSKSLEDGLGLVSPGQCCGLDSGVDVELLVLVSVDGVVVHAPEKSTQVERDHDWPVPDAHCWEP